MQFLFRAELRNLTMVGIVEWILPGEEYVENEPASGFSDMSPQGEWERRLDEAYGASSSSTRTGHDY